MFSIGKNGQKQTRDFVLHVFELNVALTVMAGNEAICGFEIFDL